MMIEPTPPIWILTAAREGDNAQLRVLAEATGLDFVEKNLLYNRFYGLPNMFKGRSLWTVLPQSRPLLQPPWPKVVLSVGRRSVPVLRWLQHQSGGATRFVQIGRPRAMLDLFDLILTTPQYRLPIRPNVLQLPVPLSRLRGVDLSREADTWRTIADGLKRPLTSLLVGGNTNAYVFDAQSAARLGAAVNGHVKARGGSLLVTTSPRTSRDAEQALSDALDVPAYFYRWSQTNGADNPYLGLLALADDIIVTSDSASLLSDATVADKPIWLFDVPMRPHKFGKQWLDAKFREVEVAEQMGRQPGVALRLLRGLGNRGLVSPPRRMARVIDDLVAGGLASRLGDEEGPRVATSELKQRCETILEQAVARIQALCD